MNSAEWFAKEFNDFNGRDPFPWQVRVFETLIKSDFVNGLTCDIPTGLGKTSVLPIWLMARRYLESICTPYANIPSHLRRLAYVVNRRTIVDQATNELERAYAFYSARRWPIAITTMRGGLASNDDWKNIAIPTIISGTPDMVVSKLLFCGYGDSRYLRPIHAGLLGYGTLFVVDEAHLSLPLCQLLEQVREQQMRQSCTCTWYREINTMYLTATPKACDNKITLNADDRLNTVVRQRLTANKTVRTHSVRGKQELQRKIVDLARTYADSNQRVLIYVRSPELAINIHATLAKKHKSAILTGTIRGHERDELLTNPIVQRFLTGAAGETVYLVSTSAGEVGWDIDADQLICDSMPLDVLIQRLGRLNRKGLNLDSEAHIVHLDKKDKLSPLDEVCKKVWATISDNWNEKSVSPHYLQDFIGRLGQTYRDLCAPTPQCVDMKDYDLDIWSMTSIDADLPGKRPLSWFIHGKDGDIPDTYLAWRDEVPLLSQMRIDPAKWYAACKLLPHELLRDASARIRVQLEALLEQVPEDYTVVDIDEGDPKLVKLHDLLNADIDYHTIVLPSGDGLCSDGMLNVARWSESDRPSRDVCELCDRHRYRLQIHNDGSCTLTALSGEETEYDTVKQFYSAFSDYKLREFASDYDNCLIVATPKAKYNRTNGVMLVRDHNAAVGLAAKRLCEAAGLPFAEQLYQAGIHHDDGKAAAIWQLAVHNPPGAEPIAKSTCGMDPSILGSRENGVYRHEFGSYLGVLGDDLTEYLVWAHHGHGRPHFRPGAVGPDGTVESLSEIPLKFAKLQKKYGYWGLAILHAILCLADIEASK